MKQYLQLLMARESLEVLGRKGTNLWILTLVLVATFSSIAFSEGSMIYLRDKMEDPFTNWVSIQDVAKETLDNFRQALSDDMNKQKFDYQGVLSDQKRYYNIYGKNNKTFYLEARFYEHIQSTLIKAILDEKNVVKGCMVDTTLLDDHTMGFIITMDAARKLGYDEAHLPSYINYLSYNSGADSLGLHVIHVGSSDFYPLALPVLAVVRRLPNNVSMASVNFCYDQLSRNDITCPVDIALHELEYLHSLAYYVSSDVGTDSFDSYVRGIVPDSLQSQLNFYDGSEEYRAMKSWRPGIIRTIDIGASHLIPRQVYNDIAKKIETNFADRNLVQRVFKLETKEMNMDRSDFLSIEFKSLRRIREFETFADSYKIKIEMEQVASKENFDAVTVIASVLSGAMVIFSIVCIIMFMVNMLQGYFQKVKKNVGTFKAFGMNGQELILVYAIILILIVFSAILLALGITWSIQVIMPLIGIEKEGFNYLSLWNVTTYVAIGVILVSTVLTVIMVMNRLLGRTPGDLIYDRV